MGQGQSSGPELQASSAQKSFQSNTECEEHENAYIIFLTLLN